MFVPSRTTLTPGIGSSVELSMILPAILPVCPAQIAAGDKAISMLPFKHRVRRNIRLARIHPPYCLNLWLVRILEKTVLKAK